MNLATTFEFKFFQNAASQKWHEVRQIVYHAPWIRAYCGRRYDDTYDPLVAEYSPVSLDGEYFCQQCRLRKMQYKNRNHIVP
jgi:hypothetical protein